MPIKNYDSNQNVFGKLPELFLLPNQSCESKIIDPLNFGQKIGLQKIW